MNSTLVHEELSPQDAQVITDEIRLNLTSTYQLIRKAWEQRAWVGMGYGSWDEYVREEFAEMSLTPPLERRTAEVASMAEAGMSVRAIGTATGMGKSSVARTLKQAEDEGLVSEDREPSLGLDGRRRAKVEVDESALDAPASDFGVGLFDAPKTKPESKSKAVATGDALPGMPASNQSPTDLRDRLSWAKQDVERAEGSVKAAIESLRASQFNASEDTDSELVARVVSSLLAQAGLLEELGVCAATVPEHSVRAKHLEVAVAVLDRVTERLGDDDEQ